MGTWVRRGCGNTPSPTIHERFRCPLHPVLSHLPVGRWVFCFLVADCPRRPLEGETSLLIGVGLLQRHEANDAVLRSASHTA